MLLALDGFIWNWAGGSISATASLSVSFTAGPGGGGGGHKHHHHHWFKQYDRADDDYWAERERMMKRHQPLAEPVKKAEKPAPEEVVVLAEKHDRLLEMAKEITNLPDLSLLLKELDQLSTQIVDIQLQFADEEALMVLLLS